MAHPPAADEHLACALPALRNRPRPPDLPGLQIPQPVGPGCQNQLLRKHSPGDVVAVLLRSTGGHRSRLGARPRVVRRLVGRDTG
eukprot:11490038-Alexandrium_andersonii.AAC.1